jgi:hypothetical protein
MSRLKSLMHSQVRTVSNTNRHTYSACQLAAKESPGSSDTKLVTSGSSSPFASHSFYCSKFYHGAFSYTQVPSPMDLLIETLVRKTQSQCIELRFPKIHELSFSGMDFVVAITGSNCSSTIHTPSVVCRPCH